MAEPTSSASSEATARTGAQEPRLEVLSGSPAYSDGPDAVALARSLGTDPFAWQEGVLWHLCARDERDRPAYVTAGLSLPRQNGKNLVLEVFEVYQMVVCGARILHTAHRVKTAKESFDRLVRYFKAEPLASLVERIRYTNGEETIVLTNGGKIQFSARSRANTRGFADIQIVVFDEAQDLTDEQVNAIMFVLAASSTGDRQMIFTGTPPDPDSPGTVFRRTRRAMLSDAPPSRSCWLEWSVEDLPSLDATFADVVDDVYATNPSMGLVLDITFTETEFANASVDGFARERCGWWDPDVSTEEPPAIDPEVWERTAIPAIGRRYQGVTALGVKFSADGTSWALAGCKAKRDRSRYACELVQLGDTSRGTRELAQAIARRKGTVSCVLVDGTNGADALCANLAEMALPKGYVVRMRTQDVVAASQMFADALVDGTLAHSTEGQRVLDDCAATATRRAIGTKGGWGFAGSIEMEACAAAAMGCRTTRRDPKRKQRIL